MLPALSLLFFVSAAATPSTRGKPRQRQIMRGLALLATLASVNADWSVPLPRRPYPDNNGFTTGRDRAPNTVSKYDERNIDEAFRADVIRGRGLLVGGRRLAVRRRLLRLRERDRSWLAKCCAWSGSWAKRCCPCNRDYAPAP